MRTGEVRLNTFPGWGRVKRLVASGRKLQVGPGTRIVTRFTTTPSINITHVVPWEEASWGVEIEGARRDSQEILDLLGTSLREHVQARGFYSAPEMGHYPGVSDVPFGYGEYLEIILDTRYRVSAATAPGYNK